VYFDGHEQEDVKEYQKKWSIRMMNYQKKIEQYEGDDMENVIPPERLEIWDTRHVLVTHDEVYFYANDDNSSFWVEDEESIIKKKGQRLAIIVSDFLCACHGPLRLTEADATRLGLDREAQVIIKPEQRADGYWKNKNMVKQLREKAIPIFNALHPGCIGVFCFDQSTNHNTYTLDTLAMFFLDEKDSTVKFKGIKK
ncbi:22698_t:CDS:2, partial [Gigaspora rosea]